MTYSSTNDATPPASQAESIAASEVEAASLVHQSLPAHISFWIQMREGIRHPISTIRQSFHPKEPFPVLVRGITLYGLWDRMPPISEGPSQLPRGVWVRQRRIGLWHAIHLVWQPVVEGNNEPWITATQANDAATTLFNFLDKIAVSVSRGSQGREPARLVYRILHVEELKAQKPRLYRFRSRKKENLIKQSEIDVQETFVEKLQRQFDLAEVDPQSGIMPNRLSHYDRSTHRRGWIVISPIRALVAGVGIKQADILANLIQLHDIDISGKHKGILPERYEYVLMRIGMWNGTQDVYETVSQLEDLVESGKKSIDGQLWLNLVLAAIGVLLAVYASPNLRVVQVWSLALLALASVFYALYARSGRFIFQALGWIFTSLSIVVAIVALGILPNVGSLPFLR